MLRRLETDVDECITAYSELAEAVFHSRVRTFLFKIEGKIKPRFDSTKLEEAI